jgi:type IX secretion system PorP/SprF family membrane protein
MFRLGTFNFYTPDMMLNKTGLISRNRMGFGAFTMFENNGPLTYFTSQIAYAYFLPLSKYTLSELSFGLSLELSQFKIDENKLDPRDEGDPELTGLNDSYFYPESGFGIYYHNEQFQIGASVNELFQTPLPYDETALIQNKRDLFFQTGYKFYLKRFELEPSLLIARIDERPIYYYSQLKLFYLNYNWISLAYKSSHTITTAFGFRVRRMTIGYAYECNVSKLQRYFGGSHEIILGINVGLYEPSGIRKTVHIRK